MDAPNTEKFNSRVAAAAFLAVIGVLAFIVIHPLVTGQVDAATANNMALTALGTLGAAAIGGITWFMRGRVAPGGGDSPLPSNPNGPTTVTVPQRPPAEPITVVTGTLPPRDDEDA